MKVRISDDELSRIIAIGLAVTGKRGQSGDHLVSVMRQFARYDVFRDATEEEKVSQDIPAFSDDYGVERAADEFVGDNAKRNLIRRNFDWPLRI